MSLQPVKKSVRVETMSGIKDSSLHAWHEDGGDKESFQRSFNLAWVPFH